MVYVFSVTEFHRIYIAAISADKFTWNDIGMVLSFPGFADIVCN